MRLLLSLLLCCSASAATIYVSPSGSDGNPGTETSPLLTLTAAQSALRAAGPSVSTVYLRGGYYFVSSGLTFTGSDNGGTWRNYSGETPVVVGGLAITNWTAAGGGIYTSDVSTQGFSGLTFRDFYYVGNRQTLTREPEAGNFFTVGSTGNTTTFTAGVGDWGAWTLDDAEVVIWPGSQWNNNIRAVDSYNAGTRLVTLASAAQYTCTAGNRYWVQNAPEMLDASGEWILTNGVVAFYAPADPSAALCWAPTGGDLITVESSASGITFRGITFTGAAGDVFQIAGSSISILGCTIRETGSWNGGTSLQGGMGVNITGGTGNTVRSCTVSGVAYNGVQAIGGSIATRTDAGHLVHNNIFREMGEITKESAGVYWGGCGVTVSHNLIQDMPRFGIWNGSAAEGVDGFIHNNVITNVMLESTDGGAIYQVARGEWRAGAGVVISNNVIRDVQGYNSSGGSTSVTGVYLDDHTSHVDVVNNVIDDVWDAGIYFHGGQFNRAWNNIVRYMYRPGLESPFALTDAKWTDEIAERVSTYDAAVSSGKYTDLRGIGVSPDISYPDDKTMIGNLWGTNIFWAENRASGATVLNGRSFYTYSGLSNFASNEYSGNLYYRTEGTAYVRDQTTSVNYTTAGWAAVTDADATAYSADPLFNADSATLQSGSPALAAGFTQIDWEAAGPYDDEYWTEQGGTLPPEPPRVIGTLSTWGRATLGRVR